MTGVNLCSRLMAAAQQHPERLALRVPQVGKNHDGHDSISYGELLSAVARMQSALQALGLSQGDRVLVLSRPAIPLYVLITALLGLGLVPVLIDRGMSRDRIFASVRLSRARVVIGDRDILKHWWLLPPLWRLRRYALDGRCFGVRDIRRLQNSHADDAQCVALDAQAHGLITFTSGSTGQPKGADRNHGSLIAQHLAIREHWPDREDDIDMPCFPVLVLHNLTCGISTVLPDMDLAFPGRVDAARVLAQIQREGITRVSGAPAYLDQLTRYAQQHQITLPQVRSLVAGGSTLTLTLVQRCLQVFPNAHARVVYGSTEAEPIADVDMPELLALWDKQEGHLVGRPADMVTVCVVNPALPLEHENDVANAQLAAGKTGEILVTGPHVLKGYVDNIDATRESKIARADGSVWHRTGDAGFFDSEGRLWLSGRIKDAVPCGTTIFYPFILEKIVDALPGVSRSALLAHDDHVTLIIEGRVPAHHLLKKILHDAGLQKTRLANISRIPVDGRHNSKIDRPLLRTALQKNKLPILDTL